LRADNVLVDPVCGKTFSMDPDDYVPLCRRCHAWSDGHGEIGAKNLEGTNAMRRRCLDCGVVYHPGGMGRHLKTTGHTGYETLERGKRKR
jgi:hypothetical protein